MKKTDCEQIEHVQALFDRSIVVKRDVANTCAVAIVEIARVLADAVLKGHKILLCGNGGSAADAQHLAAEMLVRLRPEINRQALPALSLAADMSSITACANDYTYDAYFERLVHALGQPGDVLIGITTSGRSPSVVRALQAARDRRITTVGLLGGDGMPARGHCDFAIVVPSHETGRVQEAHITTGHAMLELVEDIVLSERHA